nr:unnamed protein product [Callosobruchus chinensis]
MLLVLIRQLWSLESIPTPLLKGYQYK